MKILGLDVSTSVVGVSVVDEEKNIHHQEAIILNKSNQPKLTKYEKATRIKNVLTKVKEKHMIDFVFIEDSLANFQGKQNLKVIKMLADFNGMVSWLCYEMFEVEPIHLHPSNARKNAGFKKDSESKLNVKEQVVNFLLDNHSQFVVECTRNGNIREHYFDIADSIVVGLAGIEQTKKKGV